MSKRRFLPGLKKATQSNTKLGKIINVAAIANPVTRVPFLAKKGLDKVNSMRNAKNNAPVENPQIAIMAEEMGYSNQSIPSGSAMANAFKMAAANVATNANSASNNDASMPQGAPRTMAAKIANVVNPDMGTDGNGKQPMGMPSGNTQGEAKEVMLNKVSVEDAPKAAAEFESQKAEAAKKEAATKKASEPKKSKWWIWAIVAIVAAVAGFFLYKKLKK